VPVFNSIATPRPAGTRCSAAMSPGSGVAAPAGHATPKRTSRSPSFCAIAACDGSSSPAPTTTDGVADEAPSRDDFGLASLAATARTIGSASNDARLPDQSTDVTCTA
jgi:hypothetical protein